MALHGHNVLKEPALAPTLKGQLSDLLPVRVLMQHSYGSLATHGNEKITKMTFQKPANE